MKKYWRAAVCIFLLCLVAAAAPRYSEISSQVTRLVSADTLVIDAGHGGIDGGASGASGALEKEINLAIAKRLETLANADGWRVVMTRTDDRGLGKQEGSIRSRKTQDLKARIETIEKEGPLLTVSIHLNSFKQDPGVCGAQVFYPAGSEEEQVLSDSKRLAQTIQASLNGGTDGGKERVAMRKKDVQIFKNPKTPIVIVECGFLSNLGEEEVLLSSEYQQKLAELIYRGVMEFTGKSYLGPVEIIDSIAFGAGFQ